jgi:predicted RNase H-like HicB family nuclease
MKMKKTTYYGIMHKDKGSDYGVSFPDFPGCVAAEKTFERAIASARAALALHIAGMLEDGEAIPDPTKADGITAEDNPVAIVPVEAEVPTLRVRRYNIAARDTDMKKIDRFLQSRGRRRDRSEFLIHAALREIERQGGKKG